MKKLFIICSKRFYDKIPSVLERLNNKFEIQLPNCYDNANTEFEIKKWEKKHMYYLSPR